MNPHICIQCSGYTEQAHSLGRVLPCCRPRHHRRILSTAGRSIHFHSWERTTTEHCKVMAGARANLHINTAVRRLYWQWLHRQLTNPAVELAGSDGPTAHVYRMVA